MENLQWPTKIRLKIVWLDTSIASMKHERVSVELSMKNEISNTH